MKKFVLAFIIVFILGSSIPAMAADSPDSWTNLGYAFDHSLIFSTQANDYVLLNGERVSLDKYGGLNAQVYNGTTLVPVRVIAEMLGYDVNWSAEEPNIVVISGSDGNGAGISLRLEIDSKIFSVNGDTRTFEIAPVRIQNWTMMPVRAVCEALGKNVYWRDGLIVVTDCNLTMEDENPQQLSRLLAWLKESRPELTWDENAARIQAIVGNDVYYTQNGGLFVIKEDQTQGLPVRLPEGAVFGGIVKDKLYFMKDEPEIPDSQGGFYVASLDGTDPRRLGDYYPGNGPSVFYKPTFREIAGKLYFSYYHGGASMGGTIVNRIDEDGLTAVAKYHEGNYAISENYSYHSNLFPGSSGAILERTPLNSADAPSEAIGAEGYLYLENIAVVDDQVYCIGSKRNGGSNNEEPCYLYRLDPVTHTQVQLIDTPVESFQIRDGFLYYSDLSGQLFRTDLEGGQKLQLTTGDTGGYDFEGNDLYTISTETYTDGITIDGSLDQIRISDGEAFLKEIWNHVVSYTVEEDGSVWLLAGGYNGGIYHIFPDKLPEYGYIMPGYDIRSIHVGEDIIVYTRLYDDGVFVIGK